MPKTASRTIDPKYLENNLSDEDYQELLEYVQDLEPGSLSGIGVFSSDLKTAPTSPTTRRRLRKNLSPRDLT